MQTADISQDGCFKYDMGPVQHGRVAFLPFVPVCLKSLRKSPFDFELQTLGEQIRKKRLGLGLSQKEVGERLGVTSFTVLNWEKGKTEPLERLMRKTLDFMNQELAVDNQISVRDS